QHLARCEHCGEDVGAPNVRAARATTEIQALAVRYRAALEDAHSRNCESVIQQFQQEVAKSRAIVCRSKAELEGITAHARGSWLIGTFQQQVRAGIRAPDEPEWAWARCQDERWVPHY